MLINVHAHLTTYGEDFSVEMGRLYEENYGRKGQINWWTGKPWTAQDFCVTPQKTIEDMDRAGVDKTVIMGYHMAPMGNVKPDLAEYMTECVELYPDRLIGFYTADPLGGLKTVREIEEFVSRGKLSGVKLMPGYSEVAINDRRIWPIYEAVQESGTPLLIHTGHSSVLYAKTFTHNSPLQLEDVANDFPDLTIIAAHTGMHSEADGLTLLSRYPNIWGDLAFWGSMPFFKVAQTMVWAKHLGVFDKLLWGSDYPEHDFAPEIERYKRVPDYTVRQELEPFITPEDVDDFLGGNAKRLFGF